MVVAALQIQPVIHLNDFVRADGANLFGVIGGEHIIADGRGGVVFVIRGVVGIDAANHHFLVGADGSSRFRPGGIAEGVQPEQKGFRFAVRVGHFQAQPPGGKNLDILPQIQRVLVKIHIAPGAKALQIHGALNQPVLRLFRNILVVGADAVPVLGGGSVERIQVKGRNGLENFRQ